MRTGPSNCLVWVKFIESTLSIHQLSLSKACQRPWESHKAEAQGLQSPAGHLGWHCSTALQCQPHLRPQQPSYLTQQGRSLCHRCPSISSSPPLDRRSTRSWTPGHSNPHPKIREHHPQVNPRYKNREHHPQVCHWVNCRWAGGFPTVSPVDKSITSTNSLDLCCCCCCSIASPGP